MSIGDKIRAYHEGMSDRHHRYRSWEHCYQYFHGATPSAVAADRDVAALRLGFYLASWGMYRGSGFLLQHAYTVHLGVIDCLLSPRFSMLWEKEIGTGENDVKLVPVILDAIEAVREAYRPFATPSQASDTLVSKVLLGTLGCVPACDRFFIDGFKSAGYKYSYLNAAFIQRILGFSCDHYQELRTEQENIENIGGVRYPVMKLVDMYFWQIGFDRAGPTSRSEGDET